MARNFIFFIGHARRERIALRAWGIGFRLMVKFGFRGCCVVVSGGTEEDCYGHESVLAMSLQVLFA